MSASEPNTSERFGKAQRRAAARPLAAHRTSTEMAILDATRELLAQGSVQGLTVEAVAARSGVAKTTIYRRWRGKEELALAVLLDHAAHVIDIPELDTVRDELVALVAHAVEILGSTPMGKVMQGLISDLATDPDLAQPFHEQVIALRVAELQRLLARGVARGEVRSDVDPVFAHELLFGPVYHRLLMTGVPLDPAYAERVVDAVLPAIRC